MSPHTSSAPPQWQGACGHLAGPPSSSWAPAAPGWLCPSTCHCSFGTEVPAATRPCPEASLPLRSGSSVAPRPRVNSAHSAAFLLPGCRVGQHPKLRGPGLQTPQGVQGRGRWAQGAGRYPQSSPTWPLACSAGPASGDWQEFPGSLWLYSCPAPQVLAAAHT